MNRLEICTLPRPLPQDTDISRELSTDNVTPTRIVQPDPYIVDPLPLAPPEAQLRTDRNFDKLATPLQNYSVTQNYAFTNRDNIGSLQVNATATAVSVTLPSPTGNRRRRIIKTDSSSHAVTVVGTINGITNYLLNLQYEFLTVEPTGTSWLIVGRGILTPSFNSIAFPATQVPSSDPNTLDDYEEGTWTPSIGGNATYSTQEGRYTKIGRLVNLHCVLGITTLGTGSANTISGVPFTAANIISGSVGSWFTLAAAYVFVGCYVTGATIQFSGATAASASVTNPINLFQNGSLVYLNITFFV